MRELIDKGNIENVLKYYEYVGRDETFVNNIINQYSGFDDLEVDFDENFDTWEDNKEHIYKLFGNKLKIVQEFGEQNVCTEDMVENLRRDFLSKNGKEFNILIKILIESLRPTEINENKLTRNVEILDVVLKKGWKVTKCFSFLELNKKRLSKQQDLYSTFLQSLYVKGRLVLSIDPLDFITMSVSKSGWSSCHHPSGGYGTGCVSYMNDNATMIAYVETSDPMVASVYDEDSGKTSRIEMPNKIWRQVITINPEHDYTMQLRQYPNSSEIYGPAATELIKELLEKESSIDYISESKSMDSDDGYFQGRSRDVYRHIYYCDYYNNNFDKFTTVMRSALNDLSNLEDLINSNTIRRIVVGETAYCACGCGQENYTSHAFSEEGDYEEYDEDNYDDDEDGW